MTDQPDTEPTEQPDESDPTVAPQRAGERDGYPGDAAELRNDNEPHPAQYSVDPDADDEPGEPGEVTGEDDPRQVTPQ